MIKLLDYYYFTALRWAWGVDYHAIGGMGVILTINVLSLLLPLIIQHARFLEIFLISGVIIGAVIYLTLNRIYSKKRTEKIKEQYEDESDASRQRKTAWVIVYIIASVAFMVLVVSLTI